MTKNRTEVADIDRSLYDFTYGEEGFERLDAGITPDIVREISAKKDEPQWMLDLRLKSLEIFNRFPDPTWGPSIEGLDMDNIVTYVKPNTDQKHDWESVPDDIKNTFERLGIPDAERSYLAGVGAQYDSELVYHNMQDTASKMGIVYSGIEEALHDPQWEPLIHEKFMTLIPPTDHKFAALHGAVWSGGSFVYVPKGTKLDFPLQSYFRLNAKGAGQFEHTLIIVEDDADLHFIEGCSAPKYNVANLHAGASSSLWASVRTCATQLSRTGPRTCTTSTPSVRAWTRTATSSGSVAPSAATWATSTPMSVLNGRRARSSFTGITFAAPGRISTPAATVVLTPPRPRDRRDQGHLQERRHPDVPQLYCGDTQGRGFQGNRELPVADARRPEPLRYHPRYGHPRQERRHRPRGHHRPHRRRQGVLPDEPRYLGGRGPHHDRQRLCQPGLQGAAA